MKNPIPTYRSGWDHVYQAPFQSNNPITQESSKTISNVYPNENNYETQYQQIDNSNYQQNQAIPIETRNVDKSNTFDQSSYSYNYKTIQQFQEIQSSLQLLFNEIDLLQIAGEITEVEASDLKQLAYQGDNRVKEALRLHSQSCIFSLIIHRGNSQSLIFLLHRQDNHLEMLNHRDMTYATYLQNQNSEEDQITSTISITSQQYQIPISSSIQQSNQQFIQNDRIIPMSQSLPHLFYYNNELCGLIMKRTQTKILFKKWKHCIFVVKPTSLLLFQSIDDWRLNRAIYWYCELTPGMVGLLIVLLIRLFHLSFQRKKMKRFIIV